MSLSGTTVSHFQILEQLGVGGMGVVYRAEDTKLKRQVALKFLPPDMSGDQEANRRFVLEAQAASALNHPNICTIHEIGQTDDGRTFIAMALYEGQSLKSMLTESNGPLDLKTGLHIAYQVADGLAAAHEKGIIHRDVKPANVLVTDSGRAVVLDFGLAKLMGEAALTQTGSTLGTIAYMSPEQARAEEVDQRTDIWALGAILYEILTGRRAFGGDYDQAVVYNIINADHESLAERRPDIPEGLQSIVDRALAKNRDQRYTTADEFRADLQAVQGGDPAAIRVRKTSKNGSGIRIVIAIVSVLLAVVIGFYLFRADGVGDGRGTIKAIAVLPLVDLSGDSTEAYFAEGMTEALITELSKVHALRVTSRRSAMRYKDSDMSLKEIAAELGVDAIVEGSVVRIDDAVRVNAQLISAETDENLWAATFDRQLESVLVLHSEVARAIVTELRVSLTPDEQANLSSVRKVDPQAYEAYLKGQFHWYRLSPESFEAALEQFNLALRIDSTFSPAYTGIARVWSAAGLWGGVKPEEAVKKAREAVDKALEIDDELSEAYYNRGVAKFIYDWDYVGSERAFKRAIELEPNNATWHSLYADLLNSMMRHGEAVFEAKQGVRLDPLNSFSHASLGWVLLGARDYVGSVEAHNESIRIEPSNPLALRGRWWLNYHRGDSTAAVADAANFYEIQGLGVAATVLRRDYPGKSYQDVMRSAADALVIQAEDRFVPSMRIARLYVQAGVLDKALVLLQQSLEERFPSIVAINVDPHWDELRQKPRFNALVDRLGLPMARKQS